jgi:glycosyltransferase involved in cell wall biosynthesis
VGFIARDFDAKGGPDVLAAFQLLRGVRPDAQLLIVGSEPRLDAAKRRTLGVEWHSLLPREELLDSVLPTIDVFAYPTHFDGLPLTLLEVMARGIPFVVSDYGAMPEIVGHGAAGKVVGEGDTHGLAAALDRLLEQPENGRARERAAAWFDSHYAPDVARTLLGRVYEQALVTPDV